MRRAIKLALFCLALCSLLSAEDYRFVKIDVPGATFTIANGINARGDVVGPFLDANGIGHGYLLHKAVFTTIDFPGASFTGARAINARGDIVGRIEFADGIDHVYLLHDGQFTQIDFPGASGTIPRGFNNAGDITGNHLNSAGTIENGFILKDGAFYNVRLPNSSSTDVWMAKDNGRVIVGDAAMKPDDALHGFIRDKPGDFQLIDFPGLSVPCTSPHWINEGGEIVGLFAVVNTVNDCYNGPSTHGFLLRQGKYVVIDFPGSISTELTAINDDGEIVGDYADKNGNVHGFKAVPKDK